MASASSAVATRAARVLSVCTAARGDDASARSSASADQYDTRFCSCGALGAHGATRVVEDVLEDGLVVLADSV